jgi:hypothetical protein
MLYGASRRRGRGRHLPVLPIVDVVVLAEARRSSSRGRRVLSEASHTVRRRRLLEGRARLAQADSCAMKKNRPWIPIVLLGSALVLLMIPTFTC